MIQPSRLMRHPVHFLSLGFGSGLSPFAPGTLGTLAALPLVWLAADLSLLYLGLIAVLSFLFGIWICAQTTKALGVHDHPAIVWDEFVGYWMTMMLVPKTWPWLLAGFACFRFFDIVKPWPIAWVDRRIRGGLGVMLDDAIAGVQAAAVLWLLYRGLSYYGVIQ